MPDGHDSKSRANHAGRVIVVSDTACPPTLARFCYDALPPVSDGPA